MYQVKLEPEQEKIIKHLEGAILVLAPVGTGKTLVLTKRVAQAIEEGIPAKRVLCLTFTNRAAQQMRDRVAEYYPQYTNDLMIKTFHGLCLEMLKIEAQEIGLPKDFVIYDETDSVELIKEVFNIKNDQDVKQIANGIAHCKVKAKDRQLSLNCPPEILFAPRAMYEKDFARLAGRYQQLLRQQHALDFSDLIYLTRTMLAEYPAVQERWQKRFDLIQVDEVQDTHLSEYEIVRHLARYSGNLALIGDLDQTIYTWRGSEPEKVIDQFRRDFQPTDYHLSLNYRTTRNLLEAASSFADTFQRRYTNHKSNPNCKPGELISVYQAEDGQEEGKWIGRQIYRMASNKTNFHYNRVAVLTRSNRRSSEISKALTNMRIPCITVEQYEFFRRQEIKDALAYIRFLLNPFDTGALLRILRRPGWGIGEATLEKIRRQGESCGLKLTDFASPHTLALGDPFGSIIKSFQSGEIIVFDIETTGLSVEWDEVIQLAATRLVAGRPQGDFHAYLQNTVKVGDSQHIHGLSDKDLAQNGRPAWQVFLQFFDFAKSAIWVGHNTGLFDIKMIKAHARRLNLTIPSFVWIDTLDVAHRFIRADNYRLETLAEQLKLTKPSHRADDDVITTVGLLAHLIPMLEADSSTRKSLVNRYGEPFIPLAQQLERWRQLSEQLRPAQLLSRVIEESGLYRAYDHEPERQKHLNTLVALFQERDNPDLHPETALRALVEFSALAKNVDHLSESDNKVPIITVHQAKGLEFDTVFIAGAAEGEFPNYYSIRDNNLEEEKRLFYVALTRAREKVAITAPSVNEWGRENPLSRFIGSINKRYINQSGAGFGEEPQSILRESRNSYRP